MRDVDGRFTAGEGRRGRGFVRLGGAFARCGLISFRLAAVDHLLGLNPLLEELAGTHEILFGEPFCSRCVGGASPRCIQGGGELFQARASQRLLLGGARATALSAARRLASADASAA